MSYGVRIRELQLRGLSRNYGLKFLADGEPAPIGIIAGEIMTGKTSVLEFIDYCLGAAEHPTHPEIHDASVVRALLEIELVGELRVIERSVFPASSDAVMHWTSLEGLGRPHRVRRLPIRPPGDPRSLSHSLLEAVGLATVRLKEAPTQSSSGADPLSFRDLMWLCFMPTERLGSKMLLHETERMKRLKLTQVIEAVFGVHDDVLVDLAASIDHKEQERSKLQASIAALEQFLEEHQIGSGMDIRARLLVIDDELEGHAHERNRLDQQMRAAAEHTDHLRAAYTTAAEARNDLDVRLRDRTTLRERLSALRGQYGADISRLTFSTEAAQLFDPLTVEVCPACGGRLPDTPEIEDERCTLCGQVVSAAAAYLGIDVDREVRAIQSRLDELTEYLSDIDREVEDVLRRLEAARQAEQAAQARLDEAAAPDVAPFLSQLDAVAGRRQVLLAEQATLEQADRLRAGLRQEQANLAEVGGQIAGLKKRHAELETDRPSRAALIAEMTDRFQLILRDFRFPKLSGARIDEHFAPYVRGRHYSQFSSGGRTLIAMAWQLTIFELAFEQQQAHPGFLMIDGLQKNLRPIDREADPEFGQREIVAQVYSHLDAWISGDGAGAQVLVVDNRPPDGAAKYKLVTYSGRVDVAPYGLIDDATA